MTYRNQALQAELTARRVTERRRRATTQRESESEPAESSAWLWWLGGLSAVVAALALLG